MLGRKPSVSSGPSSTSTRNGAGTANSSNSNDMPPPPVPVYRFNSNSAAAISSATASAPMERDSFSELEDLIAQAFLSPDLKTADSAVHASAVATGADLPAVGPGTFDGTNMNMLDSDLDLWAQLSSPNLPLSNTPVLPPTPLSAFTSPILNSSPYSDVLNTPVVDDSVALFNSLGYTNIFNDLNSNVQVVSPSEAATQQLTLFDELTDSSGLSLFTDFMTSSNVPTTSSTGLPSTSTGTVKPSELGLQLKTSLSRENSWDVNNIPHHQRASSVTSSNSALSSASISPSSLASPPMALRKIPSTSSSLTLPPLNLSNLPSSPPSILPSLPNAYARRVAARAADLSTPNGLRRNIQVNDLTPLDAPVQPRNYITPSVTSRKELPPSVARSFVSTPTARKRSATAAFSSSSSTNQHEQDELIEEDELEVQSESSDIKRRRQDSTEDPEKTALLAHVEQARRRNTIAARKSRQRKLEHVRSLEEAVTALQEENNRYKHALMDRDDEIRMLRRRVGELELDRDVRRG